MEVQRYVNTHPSLLDIVPGPRRLPLVNPDGNLRNPGGAFLKLNVPPSQPEYITYNKWGGIITWTRNFNKYVDSHQVLS